MNSLSLLPVLFTFACMALAAHGEESPYLDMTYSYNENTLVHPVHREFELTIASRGSEAIGIYLESNNYCTAEHCGTHMDAPAHFAKGKWRTHQVPLDSLIGPAIRIDMKSKADADADALLEVSDIEAFEEEYGKIPEGAIVMVYTGWGTRWDDRLGYLGTETKNMSLLHYPGIGGEAAKVLLERKVKSVGIDTISLDNGPSHTFPTHITLLSENIPLFENVANLDKLPNTGATVFAIPMKIDEGSGAPTRIFATGWSKDVPNPCSIQAYGEESPYLDMTYVYNNNTLVHPVHREFAFTIVTRGSEDYGIYIESNNICSAEHCGTHMDAPAHFAKGKWRTHQVPLDSLIGPAIRIDMKAKADADADALLEVSDIEAFEEEYGKIPEGAIVMVYTGWGTRWDDSLGYLGTETKNMSLIHYPGIGEEAAKVLLERKVKSVGIDTMSLDNGPSFTFPTHVTLQSENIPLFENVANLDKLPNTGATVFAIPMKIDEGSGGPTRIFATGWSKDVPNPCRVTVGGGSQLLPYMGLMISMVYAALLGA
ncbi:uncharacterized protein LOC144445621 [Glandiceps talaboti]